MKKLAGGLRLFAFFILSLLAMAVQSVARRCGGRFRHLVPHHYFRLVARLLRMRIRVEGERPGDAPALILCNHASWLDVVALSAVAPVIFVAKQEVSGWPFFGTLAKLGGTVFVNRERRADTVPVSRRMQELLREGASVVLFPEGTTSDGNRVLPFYSALLGVVGEIGRAVPASLAYQGCFGLPMGRAARARYAWFGNMTLPNHLWGVATGGPFEVVVRFHPPLDPGAGRKHMARQAEMRVRAGLQSLLTGRERPLPVSKATELG